MYFLIDAQLPPALARWLADQDHQADHVYDLGFDRTADRQIWTYAAQTSATILTKDEDFVVLQTLNPEGPPVVWIRLGNTTRKALLAWFAPLLTKIEQALAAGDKLIEVT